LSIELYKDINKGKNDEYTALPDLNSILSLDKDDNKIEKNDKNNGDDKHKNKNNLVKEQKKN
jgi:hypothetical protein